jgi:ubiquitin-like-conjugating enzyme ATG3
VAAVKPFPSESQFVAAGTMLPEEFEEAGNQLVFKFPSWEWATGQESQIKDFLPRGKQYLVTRGVPCKDRVRALDHVLEKESTMDGDWVVPEAAASQGPASSAAPPAAEAIQIEEDFLESLAGGGLPNFDDVNDAAQEESDPAAAGGGFVVAAPDDSELRMRKYDLSITYDPYYMVPRLWLFGYDKDGRPLTKEEVYGDVLTEYVQKTVTFDPHPHEIVDTTSIHPCRHAQVMKKVVDDWVAQGKEPRVDLAIFVFLKFISGVVPTINYDFTMDIEF